VIGKCVASAASEGVSSSPGVRRLRLRAVQFVRFLARVPIALYGCRAVRRAHLRFRGRVLVVVSTAVSFVCASIGVLPSPRMIERLLVQLQLAVVSTGTDPAERFPCEGCACSCGSARECWSSCCCHTEEERIRWAIDQGVEPPASVRPTLLAKFMRAKVEQAERLASAVAAPRDTAGSDDLPPCCRARAQKGDATHDGTDDGCSTASRCASSDPSRPLGPCMSALGCKGLASALFAIAIPPAIPAVGVDFCWLDAGIRAARCEPVFVYATRALDSDEPPPRRMMA